MGQAIISTVQAAVRAALQAARQSVWRSDRLRPAGVLLVGVSGGADSLCLLHALWSLAPDLGLTLHVAHVDHGLRVSAADEAAWVSAVCQGWNLPCTVGRVDVRAIAAGRGLSLEDAARQARYGFLAQVAATVGASAVAVGHTADDQAETVLLHLIRGAGVEGLAGMAFAAPWPLPEACATGLELLRPLLGITHAQTEAYCAAAGLVPRQDETNADPAYARNRVRLEVLPLLRALNPAIVAALGRTAEIARGETALLQSVENETWLRLAVVERGCVRLKRDMFAAEPEALQRRLLRRALATIGGEDLAWEHVTAALRVARNGRTGACSSLPHGLRLRVDYAWLWVEPEHATQQESFWPELEQTVWLDLPGDARLAGVWSIVAQLVGREALPDDWQSVPSFTAYLDAERLGERVLLRPRRPGDWLVPLGMTGRQKVSDLLINLKVPASCRNALPLVEAHGQVAWVVGVRSDQRYAVTDETQRVAVLQVVQQGDSRNG